MVLDPTISIGNIILCVSLILTLSGLIINFIQLRRNWRVQKAQFISSITNELFDDSSLRKFFYEIDYEKFHFNESDLCTFKGSDQERYLDSLLYRYNLLARLVRMGVLEIVEIEFLIFEIVQVFKNNEVMKYINWLDNEYKQYGYIGINKRSRPFDDVRWLIDSMSTTNRA